MMLTVLIGSLASFALGRMRLRNGWIVTDFALLTYVLPTAFLVIPFVHLMHVYGLTDSLWAVIAAEVTFATPYAILILQRYGKLIPLELDEVGEGRWRDAAPDVSADLSAADGAGAGGGRRLCPAAGME